jgi:hypothetical protein
VYNPVSTFEINVTLLLTCGLIVWTEKYVVRFIRQQYASSIIVQSAYNQYYKVYIIQNQLNTQKNFHFTQVHIILANICNLRK